VSPPAKKKDPSITFLNRFGYNVIKLPRTGIEPMDVIGRDRMTQWLGPISRVWTGTEATPLPGPPHPAVAVNGQRTDALDLSVGLSVLANALAAFGASVPSLDVAYKSAHSIQFAYSGVTSTSVAPFDAGNYLANGTLRSDNPVVQNYFLGGKATAYLIVEVLKSNSITVTGSDSHGVGVSVDVPAIQGVVGAKVDVKPSDSSNSCITFTGPEAVTFGFAVQQILREGEKWVLRGAAPSSDIAFAVRRGVPDDRAQANQAILDTGDGDCLLAMGTLS
jgi:hypothetical protein